MDVPSGFCRCGCGSKTWTPSQNHTKHGWTKGVPLDYVKGHRQKKTREQRLAEYELDPVTGCWNWPVINGWGYGNLSLGRGNVVRAHRWFWEQLRGPIPEGQDIDHLCRNRACVNPDHLEPVSRAVNLRRGRKTKLTEAKVREIRARASKGEQHTHIAPDFAVSPQQVGHIVARKSWAEVT